MGLLVEAAFWGGGDFSFTGVAATFSASKKSDIERLG
jgi:hypothetical protein